MSDHITPEKQSGKPDALVDLYREATANDSGPDAAAREKILAYAREKAAQTKPAAPQATPESAAPTQRREAANDRRWLRHALGSLAIVGVAGWLTMQHLQEPGAPQLEQPAPASAEIAPAAPAAADDSRANAGGAAKESAVNDESQDKLRLQNAPAAAANKAARRAPSAASTQDAAPGVSAEDAIAVPAASPVQPAPVQPAPPAPAPAAKMQEPERPLQRSKPSSEQFKASEKRSAQTSSEKVELPICDAAMDIEALAEQSRRIKAQEQALAASLPLPEPAPVCRPQQDQPAAPR